jgi:hypothetical protein
MRLYSLFAAAKINLYLEIIGDRSDGFHELVMVMQSVSLTDRVTVRSIGTDEIRLRCNHPLVPTDATNLAYRAGGSAGGAVPQCDDEARWCGDYPGEAYPCGSRTGGADLRMQQRFWSGWICCGS